jgi:hypothetical protein
MCKNAASTLAALMGGIEPTLINLLTVLGIADTPEGQAAISAYNAALLAVENWKPGTSAQDVIQVIDAFTQILNALPVPTDAKSLIDIISAGIVIVIGILTGNATTDAALQAKAASDAVIKVKVLVPGFKESLWDKARADLGDHTIAAKEYKNAWNKGVQTASKVNPKYAVLKQS